MHKGDPDEGQITWVAPKFSGLNNSAAVAGTGAESGSHWYRDEADEDMWNELLGDDDDDEGVENARPAVPDKAPVRERRMSTNLQELNVSSNLLSPTPSAFAPFEMPQATSAAPTAPAGVGVMTSSMSFASFAGTAAPADVSYVPSAADATWLSEMQSKLFGGGLPAVPPTPTQQAALAHF